MRLTYTRLYDAHSKGDDWTTQTAWEIVEKLRSNSVVFDGAWCERMGDAQRDAAFDVIRDTLNKAMERK